MAAEEDPEITKIRDECIKLEGHKKKELTSTSTLQQQVTQLEKLLGIERDEEASYKQAIRDRVRKKDELKDNQANHLRLYREKFRHLLQENGGNLTTRNIEVENLTKQLTAEQSKAEGNLQKELRALLVLQKEQSQAHFEMRFSLRREQEKKITELREEFMKKIDYLRNNYREQSREVAKSNEVKNHDSCLHLEKEKDLQIGRKIQQHETAFQDIRHYFNDITHANLDQVKTLKGEVSETRKVERAKEQKLMDVVSVYRQRAGPLKKYSEEIESLKIQEEYHIKNERECTRTRKAIKQREVRVKELEWEAALLKEKILEINNENTKLDEQVQSQVQRIQQKEGLKTILLNEELQYEQQKLENMSITLAELMRRSGISNDATNGFDELVKAKDADLARLYDTLAETEEKYYSSLAFYENVLKMSNIRMDEIGFVPAEASSRHD